MTRYFLDCEFNGMGGDLISLALISADGDRELYLSVTPTLHQKPDKWVADNVLPVLNIPTAKPRFLYAYGSIGNEIAAFLIRDNDPILVADWPDDIRYFCQCLIVGPGQMVNIHGIKFEVVRVDAYPTTLSGAIQHNALWDAKALRHKIMGG
jgi:hypothetical protein